MLLVISNEFNRLYKSDRKLFYIVIVMFFIIMIAMGSIFYLFWRNFYELEDIFYIVVFGFVN